jgi:ribosome maturation factor RimP
MEKEAREGNGSRSLLVYTYMATDTHIEQITQWANEVLAAEPAYFLVNIRIKPTNNIKLYFDGDEGITIEKCVQFNRKIYKIVEEAGIYPDGDFSLEVSSPGLDEPLQLPRQYIKNKGREVEIVFTDGTKQIGSLLEVSEKDLLLQTTTGKGKKAITQQVLVSFDNIKTTTVQIKF